MCVQVFTFVSRQFTRYLLLHFTTHYGSESVCTINNVRAFGVTETEDLEAQLEALQETSADAAAAATAEFAAAAADTAYLSDLADADEVQDFMHIAESSAATLPSVDVDSGSHMHDDDSDSSYLDEIQDAVDSPDSARGAPLESDADVGATQDRGGDAVVPQLQDSSATVSQEPEQGVMDAEGASATVKEAEMEPAVTTDVPAVEAPAQQSAAGSHARKSGDKDSGNSASAEPITGGSQPGAGGGVEGEAPIAGDRSEELPLQQHSIRAQAPRKRPTRDDGGGTVERASGVPLEPCIFVRVRVVFCQTAVMPISIQGSISATAMPGTHVQIESRISMIESMLQGVQLQLHHQVLRSATMCSMCISRLHKCHRASTISCFLQAHLLFKAVAIPATVKRIRLRFLQLHKSAAPHRSLGKTRNSRALPQERATQHSRADL